MSDYAKLSLIGRSRAEILKSIDEISAWQGGDTHPVYVYLDNGPIDFRGPCTLDRLPNIEVGVTLDLELYIRTKFNLGRLRKILKSDGEDRLWLVDDPEFVNEDGHYTKIHKKRGSNFTPKKKKRKK